MSCSRRTFLQHTGSIAVGSAIPGQAARAFTGSRTRHGTPLTLVSGGKTTYAITVLPGAPRAAQHAARELQHYLREISDVRLPIASHADVAAGRLPLGVRPGHLITLGAAPADAGLTGDAFRIRTDGPTLSITGAGPRGTLYGCYALLEEKFGVRWFTPEITRIPARATVTLEPLDWRETPTFEYRYPYWGETMHDQAWTVHNRLNANGSDIGWERLDANVGGGLHYGLDYWVHSIPTLIPQGDYPQLWKNGQICFTDPEAVTVGVTRLKAAIKGEPTATVWSVSQGDDDNRCNCERCQAVYQEEGAPSGALIRFVNAIAEQIAPAYPNVLIDTLAYRWSEAPPKHARPRANVRVRFAPLLACVAHPLGTCEKNKASYDNLVGWSKISNKLYMWHYATNYSHYFVPLPNVYAMAGDFAAFHRCGGVGMFSEGTWAPGASFAELKAYLQSKLMWNPTRDPHSIVQDFVKGVYGAGAPYIQQWLDAVEAEVDPTAHPGVHAGVYDPPTAPYLPDALLDKGASLLEQATRAAADDPNALDQIRKVQLGVDYVRWQRSPQGSAEAARYGKAVETTMHYFNLPTMHE